MGKWVPWEGRVGTLGGEGGRECGYPEGEGGREGEYPGR